MLTQSNTLSAVPQHLFQHSSFSNTTLISLECHTNTIVVCIINRTVSIELGWQMGRGEAPSLAPFSVSASSNHLQ